MASTSEKPATAKKVVDKIARREKKLAAQQAAAAAAVATASQLSTNNNQQQNNDNNQENGMKIIHEEQILEAIDQLRRRKARPDADRICNYLLRKFSVDARDTIADLHRLIEAEKVIQVDYKGNTSYRNASKWTRLQLYKNRPEGFVKEKINSNMVAGAVAELVVEEPDYLDQGVPAVRLIEQLLDGVSNPTSRRMVEDFLTKEVASGNLARLNNGNYSLVDGSSSNGVSNSDLPQQNGTSEVVVITNPKSSTPTNTTATSTPFKETSHTYDLADFKEFVEHDSNLNTMKSRQSSPKTVVEPMKKEDCFEIIGIARKQVSEETEIKIKDTNGKLDNGCKKENNLKQNGRSSNSPNLVIKEEPKNGTETQTSQKKSKTERKQRLCVRNDDSTDLVFKYEDFRTTKESTYKDEPDCKDDTNDRLSEDGEGDCDNGRSSTNPSPTPSNHNAGSFRSARRKRAKKVFDPSDNMVVKRKRGRYAKSVNSLSSSQDGQETTTKTAALKESPKDPNRQCSLCSKNKQEALTACRDCTVRAHPSCIYTPEEMVLKAHTSWQCERCKTCVVCYETSDVGPLVTCFNCDDAYHVSCHTPRIPASKSKWSCADCNKKTYKPSPPQNTNNNWNNNNSLELKTNSTTVTRVVTPQVSPTRNTSEHADDEEETVVAAAIDPNIPDASEWSVEQVYQYFYRYFPHESKIFKTEEIDGPTLMLLKRSDIIGRFGLLMGPALKIWRHVVILQHRRDDTRLYWL